MEKCVCISLCLHIVLGGIGAHGSVLRSRSSSLHPICVHSIEQAERAWLFHLLTVGGP